MMYLGNGVAEGEREAPEASELIAQAHERLGA
jgi:hypothetical protein